MTITRTINGKSHVFTLTESELWEAWREMQDTRERNYITGYIEENYDGCIDSNVYAMLQSEEVVDEIWEEAHFRAEAGWGSFETNADMLIEAKLEELSDEIDLTEDEEE